MTNQSDFDPNKRRVVTSVGPVKTVHPPSPPREDKPELLRGNRPPNVPRYVPDELAATAPKPSREDEIISMLLNGPRDICDAQATFDVADRLYKARLAQITIGAFNVPLFPGKKEGEPMRAASNDTERDAAVAHMIANDVTLIDLVQEREAALRSLSYAKNRFEAARLIAGLLSTKG